MGASVPSCRTCGLFLPLLPVVGLWAVVFGAASLAAPTLLGEAIPLLEARLSGIGIGLGDCSVSAIRISPWLNGVALGDVQARLDLNRRDRLQLPSRLAIDAIDLRLTDWMGLRGRLHAEGLEVRIDASDRPPGWPFDRFANASLTIGDLPLGHPARTVEAVRTKIRDLFFENAASGEVEFAGDVLLDVDGTEFPARLYTERDGDRFRLRFRSEDIRRISDAKQLGLVEEQVGIVAEFPLRAPVIMRLTEQARDSARRHAPDDDWLQDAHRHVVWSFLLTRAFGPEFATRVTDAQEMRPGNTPNERAMDFHNNAVGRRLVADGVGLAELPQRIRGDARIIRHPDEVDRFAAGPLLR